MSYKNKSKFDLNQYETVKSRKVRLRSDHPDSVIMPLPLSDLNYSASYVLMGAIIWKNKKDMMEIESNRMNKVFDLATKATPQNAGAIMMSIAALTGADGVGYSLSIAGGPGADTNAWVENAEESAVGRALDNMGYHSGSASQEEIKKVEHMEEARKHRVQLENQINSMYGTLIQQGNNPDYLQQVISQAAKPFNHLSELSPNDLENLLNALREINNQGAYQSQKNYAPNIAAVPGAPAPPR